MVHQTARDFLLRHTESEFRVDFEAAQARVAIACLRFLYSDEMKPPKNRRLLGTLTAETSAFRDYACNSLDAARFSTPLVCGQMQKLIEPGTSFSEHVVAAIPNMKRSSRCWTVSCEPTF